MLIYPSKLSGAITPPPSKSHSMRAVMFSMLAQGKSFIRRPLLSPDTLAMRRAIALFGSKVTERDEGWEIQGGFSPAEDVIDAGNAGQVLRFIAALAALQPSYTVITGDASIRERRPIQPLLSALKQLGGFAESSRGDGYAPIILRGPIGPGRCRLEGRDSQPVSALLMATSLLPGKSEIYVDHPGETPWIDLTLDWLKRLGAVVRHDNYTHYEVEGSLIIDPLTYSVPSDFSTAAFPIAAALVTHSALEIHHLDPNDIQGDKQLIEVLRAMGAKIEWRESSLVIDEGSHLYGIEIDVNPIIDALPILTVVSCFAKGKTRLYNGLIARHKECDRIASICQELQKMGAQIEEHEDGLTIHESDLIGARVLSHGDHRIALSLAVAGMGAQGETEIEGAGCMTKTYPHFVPEFQNIGAHIECDSLRV